MLNILTPMGLASFVVQKRSVTTPTAPPSSHGTAVPVAARVAAVDLGADPGPPRGAPV